MQTVGNVQYTPEEVASTPLWLGELAVMVDRFRKADLEQAIKEKVRLIRGRFGHYEPIDFVFLLLGYAVSAERTYEDYHAHLRPVAQTVEALFHRSRLPHPSTLSRFLDDVDEPCVEALRALFLQDLMTHTPFASSGGLWDREGKQWVMVDIDGTKQAARQRALPSGPAFPEPRRRMGKVCAKGYFGRKRGEVGRTRTTVLQPCTHQWIGTFSGAGNGEYRCELQQAIQAIKSLMMAQKIPLSSVMLRLDGLYGNGVVIAEVLAHQIGLTGRCKDYGLLDLPVVQACFRLPPAQQVTHPETGTSRILFDCPEVPLTPDGPCVRLIIATHPHGSRKKKPAVGTVRGSTVYELFVTTAPQQGFTPSDVLGVYLHRGAFETVLADEDQEQSTDRWVSHSAYGQELWQILNQWVWNIRLELGQRLHPTEMRLTEFAPAHVLASPLISEPAPIEEPALIEEPGSYGPPHWAKAAQMGGLPGSHFRPQEDGTLLCPADQHLYPQERRPERGGSVRLVYSARPASCAACRLREQCLGYGTATKKPRRVSAVIWPLQGESSPQTTKALPLTPVAGGDLPVETAQQPDHQPEAFLPATLSLQAVHPLLLGDWQRCRIRRTWVELMRTQAVTVTIHPTVPPPLLLASPRIITRAERAHSRLNWQQRLARNARPSNAPPIKITIHGLPASFAHSFYPVPLA